MIAKDDELFASSLLLGVNCHPSQKWGKLDPCCYCGQPSDTDEHINPRSNGGPNGWENKSRACAKCNKTRGNRSLLTFMVKGGLRLT